MFLGSIKRGHKIPVNLTLDAIPTGTPTYRILSATRVEIVAVTNLTGSGLLWYVNDQTVGDSDSEGEYSIEYVAVIDGVTRYAYDNYEVPPVSSIASGEAVSSGSSDWTQTRDDIINQILQKVGALEEGGTASAEQIALVSTELNQFVKWLQVVHQIKLWKLEWGTKTFSAPSEVTIDDVIYTCTRSHTSATSNNPLIGDDGSTYWRIKGTTGGVWAADTAYYSTGDFLDATDLIGIEKAYIRKNNIDRPVEVVGSASYAEISNKTSFGDPITIFFDNKLTPTIFLYPQVEDVDDVVVHYQKILRIDDFDVASNTPDFPVHWIAPIVWSVAHDVGIIYKLPSQELRDIEKKADKYLGGILDSTKEYAEFMRISPNLRSR
jgi:hypothetical protein